MKKKFVSLLLASCMVLPCAFMLNACDGGGETCQHEWRATSGPTATEVGLLVCRNPDCFETFDLPKLNETDYEVNATNPDYVTYTYTKDNQSFTFNQNNFVFNQSSGEEGVVLFIEEYTGSSSQIVIPEKVSGMYYPMGYEPECCEVPIVGIDEGVFMNNTNIVSVSLPNSIMLISANAFKGCSNLTEVDLPDDCAVYDYAFANTALTEIVVPAECGFPGDNVFEGCNSLTTVYHMRSDKNEWFGYDRNRVFNDATQYYYSETRPSGLDYLNNDGVMDTWHYDDNNPVLWQVNFTNNVENKSFTYSHSEVSFSDTYWAMLKEAEAQNMLGDLFDNDQTQIEMVTSSATKAEYETKFAAWYATTMGTQAVVSFADGKITIALLGASKQVAYIEVDGEIFDTTKKEKVFTFDTVNNTVYEERADEHSSIRHVYSIVE